MKDFLSILVWVPSLAAKALLAVIGWFVVPFTNKDHPIWGNNEHPNPPNWYREGQPEWWRDYVWRGWRNMVNNVRYLIKEPSAEVVKGDNPDDVVRSGKAKKASRWVRSGLYSEYWWMRTIDWTFRGRHYTFFEFRIGWKFSGVEGFAPTFQIGPRSR